MNSKWRLPLFIRDRFDSTSVLLFAAVFVLHGYFYNGVSWNQNARYDLVYSIVEPGIDQGFPFSINHFVVGSSAQPNTGDWSLHDGRYYSNKAPGASFMAAGLYLFLFHGESLLGLDPAAPILAQINAYLMNLWVSVFWSALATVVLFQFLRRRWGATRKADVDALWVAVAFAFGTLIFPFDTQFWGHTTAAAWILFGTVAAMSGKDRWRVLLAGFCLGWAVCIEYAAALYVPLVGAYCLWRTKSWKDGVVFAAAASIGIGLLMAYQEICFDSFLTPAPSLSNPVFLAKEDIGGLFGRFNGETILRNLFSWNRGLLIFCPILCLTFVGLRARWRSPERLFLLLCWSCILGTILLISSFNGAEGGASSGPRYLIASLPFWCLLLPQVSTLSRPFRRVFAILLALSILNMTVIAFVSPMLSPQMRNVWWDGIYGYFLSGRFPLRTMLAHYRGQVTPELSRFSTFTLGTLLGRVGPVGSLLIWQAMAAGFVWAIWVRIAPSTRYESIPPGTDSGT